MNRNLVECNNVVLFQSTEELAEAKLAEEQTALMSRLMSEAINVFWDHGILLEEIRVSWQPDGTYIADAGGKFKK